MDRGSGIQGKKFRDVRSLIRFWSYLLFSDFTAVLSAHDLGKVELSKIG